jgi:uncharacterized membrane protein
VPNFHPILIHFPIVLLTVGAIFDILSVALRKPELEVVGRWSQLLGSAGLAAAVISGILAGSTFSFEGESLSVLQSHQQLAFAVSILAALSLFWRISSRLRIPTHRTWLFLLLLATTVVLMWIGAWHGGEMVYRFGIGVHNLQ